MNFSAPFIRRPIMTILLTATIIFFGFLSFRALPVSDMPSIEYPTIQVTVDYPGAEPETMANNVTAPLEKQFLTIQGLENISSTSTTGNATIVLQFNLNKSIDSAATDVQAAITAANPQLPQNLPYAPTFSKVNPTTMPILYYAITSSTMTKGDLYDYAYNTIGQKISLIDGVSQVFTYGSPFAVRIKVDPQKLRARNIGIDELALAVQNQNVNMPVGVLYGLNKEYTIDVDGQLADAELYNQVIIRNKDGAIVRVRDVGIAENSIQDDKFFLEYVSGSIKETACVIAVVKRPEANTVAVIDAIHTILPRIQGELPGSIRFWKFYDQSVFIEESLHDVEFTLLIAVFLVILVVFLYLGKFVDSIVPMVAIPISILGTFITLSIFGFNLDILSLLAITLSIGFLVDDAIVMLENIARHVEMGKTPWQAALDGAKQICFTIISMTLSLIAIFIPMLFMGGIMGRIFHEFAVTIVSAVLISGFVSLTVTPMLCSRLIKPHGTYEKTSIEKFSEKFNAKLVSIYQKRLDWSLNNRKIILFGGVLSVFLSGVLFYSISKEFLPPDDIGFIRTVTQGEDSASPYLINRYHDMIIPQLQRNPAFQDFISVVGYPSGNQGEFFFTLKPWGQRPPMQEVINEIQSKYNQIPGFQVFSKGLPLINLDVGTNASTGNYQYVLQSLKSDELYKYGQKFYQEMQKLPGFTQAYSDLKIKQPQLKLHILRDRASVLNVSADAIETALGFAFAEGNLSPINEPENQYYVILELLNKFADFPDRLSQLYVRSDTQNLVPLSQIVEATQTVGPLSVNRLNGMPSVTISFNLEGVPLSTGLKRLDTLAKEVLPPTVTGQVQGAASIFKESFATLGLLFIVTMFIIYVILGILYENFFHPLTVMSTLPPAAIGGLLTLYIFHESLSLYGFVGLILLLGIVMKNGIILIDFANEAILNENKGVVEAIRSACLVRFRPILMTTCSALMGAIPIALGMGGMAAMSRRTLGMVIVGGLIISQILTLFLTPVLFIFLEEFREWIERKREKKTAEPKHL